MYSGGEMIGEVIFVSEGLPVFISVLEMVQYVTTDHQSNQTVETLDLAVSF